MNEDDPRLIEYIRQHVIVPPSTEPYNLYYGVNHDPSDGQSKVIDELLNHKVVFRNENIRGDIFHSHEYYYIGYPWDLSIAKCFPLYSFLLALGTTTVDFLSLDVESSEYKVLQSIPWDKLDIKVKNTSAVFGQTLPFRLTTLSVEYNLIPEGKPALIDLMKSKGYIHYMELNRPYSNDLIFVKQEVWDNSKVRKRALPIIDINNTMSWIARSNFES
ncbi:hypothetical protein HAZT_HAZT006464 [Hyalella azteca]|uniref:Methyltransferase FkbM domain-containing protein n=1 Tax=Hyalella azteca TaxID=294128 RepID=A0A6A0GVE8_HYAAZ|nr:hypothetical protein HAZT_HAZT006464 [Hyalella azteca]